MSFLADIQEKSLWDTLKTETRPLVLYGTGNGGDKILDELNRRGVSVSGVFASAGFVRNRTFRGFPVESLDTLTERLGNDIVILLAFGSSLPEVMEAVERLGEKFTLLIPEVPLFGGDIFDREYLMAHGKELEAVYDLLYDDISRELFQDMIRYRLTGSIRYLYLTEPMENSVRNLFCNRSIRHVFDGGAFTGDTARIFSSALPCVEKITAVEPDERAFRRLSAYAEEETRTRILPVCKMLCGKDGFETFFSAGSRASAENSLHRRGKEILRETRTVDTLCVAEKVDLIKLDVEGMEAEVIRGMKQTILRDRPHLMISLYHRTEDLFALPLMIHEILPQYEFRLRRVPCLPAWDLVLYASVK